MNIMVQEGKKVVKVGTHNGIFHVDEVFAVAAWCLYNRDQEITIVRSNLLSELKDCDVIISFGSEERKEERENGVKYASSGIIWKEIGEQLIKSLYNSRLSSYSKGLVQSVWTEIDTEIVSKIDAEDNGKHSEPHKFSFVENYIPVWYKKQGYDEAFKEAVEVVSSILEKEIMKKIAKFTADGEISYRYAHFDEENGKEPYYLRNVLELPNQTIPWIDSVIGINEEEAANKDAIINFVIFPCVEEECWAAQCVPPTVEKKFDQRIPFPKEWAGKTKRELAKISGVEDAIFCHKGRFLVKAKTKEGAKRLCYEAMKN